MESIILVLDPLIVIGDFNILPNHYVHPGYHEMRTHRRRSVHRSFAVGSVVLMIVLQLSVFWPVLVAVSLLFFAHLFIPFTVDALHYIQVFLRPEYFSCTVTRHSVWLGCSAE